MPPISDPNDLAFAVHWIEKMKCVVVVHDFLGRILWTNPYAEVIYGGSMHGLMVYDILDPKFRDLAAFRLRAVIRDGFKPDDITMEYHDVNGEAFWLRTRSILALWRGDRVIVTIAENMTPEWELYQYIYDLIMRNLSKRERQFIIYAAHNHNEREAAHKMGIDYRDAIRYRKRIYKKFNFTEEKYKETLWYIFFYDFFFPTD